jgi:hypothetical protein
MKTNQYSMQPKRKPNIDSEPPKKHSLASILEKYEKDLCQEVCIKLNN